MLGWGAGLLLPSWAWGCHCQDRVRFLLLGLGAGAISARTGQGSHCRFKMAASIVGVGHRGYHFWDRVGMLLARQIFHCLFWVWVYNAGAG